MKPVSFDAHNINDSTNYRSAILRDGYGLPQVEAQVVERSTAWPLIGGVRRPGKQLYLDIIISGTGSLPALRQQLHDWLDPEDETPKKLIVESDTGGNNRYVYCLCERLTAVDDSLLHWVATLRVHGDVRWRENTATTDTWAITASGQTKAITNNGQDDAYPILTITPTSNKTGGYAYKRFITVRWNASLAANDYPVDITNDSFDTAALVTGGKMQADGDDLRVWVDGAQVDRWLDGINTTTTKVWCNLDFSPAAEVLLLSNIGTGDTTVPAASSVAAYPGSGILKIDNELITYTGKDNTLNQFTGCTRGAKGSSAATHTAGATIIWVQHDIWILYGNSTAVSPPASALIQPMLALASSTNTSWDFDNFRQQSRPNRSAAWTREYLTSPVHFYGGNQGASADLYVEIGVNCTHAGGSNPEGRFSIYNPCGITNVNFANGQKYSTNIGSWVNVAKVQSCAAGGAWTDEYVIPAPSAGSTWESWSYSAALSQTAVYVGEWLLQRWYPHINKLEAADVTLTLDSAVTPAIVVGAEQGNYSLDCRISNTTTGEYIALEFSMALNADLEVNTDAKTVTYLLDNSPQISALVMEARRHWLRLQPGSNTIEFEDAGTAGVTIDFEWEERHYQ